jgi:uncharacterized membrane protein YkvA (DUF1232 family)
MSCWKSLLVGVVVLLSVYVAGVLVLVVVGRRTDARALARFVPDCLILFGRLLGDRRVPRSRKLLIGALIGYLALPFDLVPDFIPVVGQLDDVLVVALALRIVLRSGGADLVREHWPGPLVSLRVLVRLAYGSQAADGI